jgi:Leucine-rich repeat (LRR) protein
MLHLSWQRQTLSTHSKQTFKRAFEHSFTHIQEMADQLLFGTAEGIINTLTSLVSKEIGLLGGVEGELKSLMNTVSTIKAVLLDAEEKQAAGDHAVKDWLGKLKDVIYDADDLLDAVSTEVPRREIITHDKKAKKVRVFFSKSNQLAYRHKTAHKIKVMRKRLDAINADRERFHLVVRDAETRVGNRLHASRETYSFVRAESVIGRDGDKKAVIHCLMDTNVEDNVSILPIVAIGGLGKTTLAQLIFNDEQIQNHFELKMWVCVSDPFHVKDIVEKILESATNKKQQDVQMNTLVNYLREEINGKKYLLVLDDVWNEDLRKWSDLKEVLMVGGRGSRILVTTRNERVAKICGTVDSYSLRGLNEHASWSLFMQMAFEKGQEPEENSSIAATGMEILQKCSGVPLAIRTIGSLLRFKNSETEWLNFKNDKLSKIPQNETDILPTLKLSYDQLLPHLKHCFAYCSLFPKDYKFKRSTLIQLWIAQGFVKLSDQHRCLEDVGNEYFMDLLWRSFFQEAEMDEFGNVTQCKMHDLMHDLAILEAGSLITTLNDREINFDEKTRHVSIGCDINTLSITTSLCKASGIRTFLCLTPNYLGDESYYEAIVSSFKFLRTLVLQRQGKHFFLPSSIEKLKHLRYLDLSDNFYLKKLPNSITKLQNLQTLILFNCFRLEELPKDMKKLVNLRHLEIDGCGELTYMPRGLGELTNLQTLSKFAVHWDPLSNDSSGLKELHRLNNLRGKLEIVNLRYVKDVASECKIANLKEKEHLHALTLWWCSREGVNDSDVDVDAELLLEDLQPHPNLKELRFVLYDCKSLRLPSWLSSLTNLVRFELYECKECQYMPPLSQLPSLKYLSLRKLEAMEYISIGNEFSSSSSAPIPFFPSLKKIVFHKCFNLRGWLRRRHSSVEVNSDGDNSVEIMTETPMTEHFLLPSFPCLSTLEIYDCPVLTSMPMFPHLERELVLMNTSSKPLQQTMMMNMPAPQSLTTTTIGSSSSTPLSKLKFIKLDSIADLETLPEEWLKNLTSLESLRIYKCHKLNSISQGIQHLTALRDLEIGSCPELELANDEDGMQWQGLKSLFSLKFSHLPKLVTLPLGLQHVTTLQKLVISNCYNLTAIPKWIQNCTSLQEFKISDCSRLTSLPEGMRSLTSLQWLKIYRCPILLQRCEREVGDDWPKIAYIPNLEF